MIKVSSVVGGRPWQRPCPALMPLPSTLEVAVQQDLGADAHPELCA